MNLHRQRYRWQSTGPNVNSSELNENQKYNVEYCKVCYIITQHKVTQLMSIMSYNII